MPLPIQAWPQTVCPLKILYEVALIIHAHFDNDLLISQKRCLQKFARPFDPEFLEVADWCHSCLRLKEMFEARIGKIDRRCHMADRQVSVKISAHNCYYFNYSWIHVLHSPVSRKLIKSQGSLRNLFYAAMANAPFNQLARVA